MEARQGSDAIAELWRRWESRHELGWDEDAEAYLGAGKEALDLGDPSLAYDILKAGLALFPRHDPMAYAAALAQARGGAAGAAGALLQQLLARLAPGDELEVMALSLAGRLAKDRATRLLGEGRQAALEESVDAYEKAFEVSGDPFPGINAASMSVLCGRHDEAAPIARRVRTAARAVADAEPEDPWSAATVAEASLLLGDGDLAERWYTEAVKRAGRNWGTVSTMARQVRLLAAEIEIPTSLTAALALPSVVSFFSIMTSSSAHPEDPIGPQALQTARAEIDRMLARVDAGFGYCSAACGPDLLFIEAMLERGGEVHVTLPFRRDDFVTTCVAWGGPEWVERFERALAAVTSVGFATQEGFLGDESLFRYSADVIAGSSALRAQALGVDPWMLAVVPTGGSDEGAKTLATWRAIGRPGELVEIPSVGAIARPDPAPSAVESAAPTGRISREVQTMLFADVVGFSKMGEDVAPSFFVHFLGKVAQVIESTEPQPAFCNTWGDGLFLVFDQLEAAADFALRLRDEVATTDWSAVGLPADTSIRIGLHSGPVFRAEDPIIQRRNYYGSHVNRAARIEPVTAAGAVFVSEQAAALLAASGARDLACDFLGTVALAKMFGQGALYRLRRSGQAE